jgi:predicted nucleic acid-binding protein
MTWLLVGGKSVDIEYCTSVRAALRKQDNAAHVPMTWKLEVANVLLRAEAQRQVNDAQSDVFFQLLSELPVEVDSETADRCPTDVMRLGRRYQLSSYDATYLELALRYTLPIATLDSDLRKAAKRAGVALFQP